jgi:hypothetical protein
MKHKIYRLRCACAVVVLLTTLLAIAGCKSNSNNPASQPASAAKPAPSSSRRLIKTGGWEIPGLSGAKEGRKPVFLPASGNAKVYFTRLTPRPTSNDAEPSPTVGVRRIKSASMPTLKNYLSEGELKELGITAKGLTITTIVKYDIGDNSRPFCYVVKYRSTYAVEALHYYDEDGDKRFELLETGTPAQVFVPRIPGWAQQQ